MIYGTRLKEMARKGRDLLFDAAGHLRAQLFRTWRTSVLTLIVGLAVVLFSGICALVRTPGWYDPPVIPPEERQDVRNNLLNAEQAFTESLMNTSEAFTYHLYQDDVNRWVAMRREIYPLIDELAPPQLQDPFVIFDDGEITLAGKLRAAGVELVFSVDLSVSYEDDAIVLRVGAIRCGSVRLPWDAADLPLRATVDRAAGESWPGSPRVWGNLAEGLHIGNTAQWKNGGVRYRVTGVESQDGALNLTVQPLGRPEKTRRSRQS